MELSGFAGCCGAGIIYALDDEYRRQRPYQGMEFKNPTPESTEQSVRDLIARGILYRWGAVFATTNPGQAETTKVLERLGFKLLHTWKNQVIGHQGTELKLWGLDLYNQEAYYPQTNTTPPVANS